MSTIEQAFEIQAPCQNKCPDCGKKSRAVTDIHTCTPTSIPNPADLAFTESTVPMTIQSIATWFTLAVPEPTDKNRAVQLGCHFEEISEMFEALREPAVAAQLDRIATRYKTGEGQAGWGYIDRKELLDSLCDQIVTIVGVAHMHGLNIQGALAEVNRSNYSKFVNGKPVFDANGKIDKNHAGYSKPNLTPFVGN